MSGDTLKKSKIPVPAALIFLYMAGLFAFVHGRSAGLTDRDGYFHARYAAELPSRGLSRSFPWTQASVWKDAFFDKEFLFHAALAPFTQSEDPVHGAVFVSSLLSAACFALFYLVMLRGGVPWPAAATALLAGMGGPFLLRMSFVRSHVLSILLFTAGLHFMNRRDWKKIAGLGFLYSWSCSFPLILPVIAAVHAAGRFLAEGADPDWRSPAAALGGVLAGLAIHPYTPLSLGTLAVYSQVFWTALSAGNPGVLELAREFAPYSTRSFLAGYPMLALTVLGLGLFGWRARGRTGGEAMGLFAAGSFAFAAAFVFARFIEYAAPLAAASAAFLFRDQAREQKPILGSAAKEAVRRKVLAAGVLLLLAGNHLHSVSYVLAITKDNPPPRFEKAAAWMAENLAPGETVVNLWWEDFPELYYHGARQHYLVGLDPAYMLRWDAPTALALEAMRTGRVPIDPAWLAATFDARWMIMRAEVAGFYPQLDCRFRSGESVKEILACWRPAYADKSARIYALPAGQQSGPFIPK